MKTHEDLARANHAQASAPDGPVPLGLDWRVTMYFYAAVHAVNHAQFAGQLAPQSYRHEQRRVDVQHHPVLRHVARQYTRLEDLATMARYLPAMHPITDSQVRAARLWSTEILKRAGVEIP